MHIGQSKEVRVPTLQPKYVLYAMTVYGLKNLRAELSELCLQLFQGWLGNLQTRRHEKAGLEISLQKRKI